MPPTDAATATPSVALARRAGLFSSLWGGSQRSLIGNVGGLILVVVTLLATIVTPTASVDALEPPRVLINEIHYHPPCADAFTPCNDAPHEFIELVNVSGDAVDMTNWALADGIDFAMPAGTVLSNGAFVVIAEDPTALLDAFGINALGPYSGQLSNSGERVALLDAFGVVVDEITYADGSGVPGAWSVSADGDGNSLQLQSTENVDGTSRWWDAALPTPRAANTVLGTGTGATVGSFTWTVLPAPGQNIDVQAQVYGAENVQLEYTVGYPGTMGSTLLTSNDGVNFTGTVPATDYGAGDLVRFRLQTDGVVIAPRADDTIDWVGTTVSDPSVTTTLPLLEWFTSQENYDLAKDETGDTTYDGVLAYNGEVWDNVEFRIRGAIARGSEWTKRNWKFRFPDHHDFVIDAIGYPVDTIDLQGGFADETRIREHLGHTIAGEMGLVAVDTQHVRLHLNGEYFGLHTLQEHPDGGFMRDRDLTNATLFKHVNGFYESGPGGVEAQTNVNFENWDIPEYINLLAAASVLQHNDFAHGNFYWWYDADEHQRFEGMIWDLDMSQGIRYKPSDGLTVMLEDGNAWSYVWHRWKNQAAVFAQVLNQPFRELYLRRLRTLADEWYGTGRYEQMARDAFATLGNEWYDDTAKWGFWGGQDYGNQQAIDRLADSWIDQYYAHIQAGGPDGDIPGPQPANPSLTLVVEPDPSDQRTEHIQIINNESTAIDISGWQLAGSTTATLAPGAVLPANGSAYLVGDDRVDGFRAATDNLYVLGEYDAPLSDLGGTIELIDGAGTAHADTAWGNGAPPVGMVLNEWNAVSSTSTLLEGDGRLGTIVGNGGDWFELVVVQDHLDIRGWTLDIIDSGALDQTLAFTEDPLWSDLRAGTIITVGERPAIIAEDNTIYAQDVSYWPEVGDYWIHVVSGPNGTGEYITAGSFRVSNDDWKLQINDAQGRRTFGPAGEGIGSLASGGVNNSQIGELEADPTPDTTPASPYGDGDSSTFGAPNIYAEQAQGLSRPALNWPGDTDCSGNTGLLDALFISQYMVGLRSDGQGACDEATMNLGAADFDGDGSVSLLDALAISRCIVGFDLPVCPPQP